MVFRVLFCKLIVLIITSTLITGCNDLAAKAVTDDSRLPSDNTSTPTNTSNPENIPAPTEIPGLGRSDVRMFIFGHSLIVHEATPEPTEEKKVPHWMGQLSAAAGNNYNVDGQYGFVPSHADFSQLGPQWGFDQVSGIWANENTPFSQIDYNVIMMTPANFIQYQPPSANYFGDTQSPIDATLSLFDQNRAAHPNIPFYIYENWPDMGTYGAFPGGVDIAQYHNDTIEGGFHQWFLQYHNALLAARSGSNIKMIPTGPVISKLLRDTELSNIPLTVLYEDDAPHGQPTLYFLASLVTYMAIYQTPAPANFQIPNTVSPIVRDNYAMVVAFIWNELQNFNDENGNSRVF